MGLMYTLLIKKLRSMLRVDCGKKASGRIMDFLNNYLGRY
ncbi:MAG: hypothetical protein UU46_C0011G0023 [Candidatus Uhrbacteria bacterium GW2011_GWD1_41_16]|nr:MAG: hypothetical protein UU46_C0011G0023 [Candidatus Uhrbacteria bacterium GW2011_GWD1_41_16]KKS07804.1 MAG: hypothetical protein UU62_C0011G0023 [Candidatus Uhrbacteria bacterium GW2011_GWF2_41_40]